jgi:hypothetical protein
MTGTLAIATGAHASGSEPVVSVSTANITFTWVVLLNAVVMGHIAERRVTALVLWDEGHPCVAERARDVTPIVGRTTHVGAGRTKQLAAFVPPPVATDLVACAAAHRDRVAGDHAGVSALGHVNVDHSVREERAPLPPGR